MNLRDLDYIVAINDLGSMAKAAARCHVSQSTLSIQLKKLEEYLGVLIFERNNKRLTLTQPGKSILDVARGIVNESRRLVEIAQAHSDPMAGIFRLGVFPTLAPYYLPKIMPMISAGFPRLIPRLIEEKSPVLTEELRGGTLDAALLSLPVEGQNLETAHLFDDPFFLACRSDHPMATRTEVAMSDLAHLPLLLLDEGHCLRNQALDLCFAGGMSETGEFRATSLET
ncbi:MAG: LysR substrate-binding domain-containing protein, partial [Pseudomonadota bacterium]|nr:LysR substrate-binding domain-containing protein [Pseudomonadota bacterium]